MITDYLKIGLMLCCLVMFTGCGNNDTVDYPEEDVTESEAEQPEQTEAEQQDPDFDDVDEDELLELDPSNVRSQIREALDDNNRLHVLNRTTEALKNDLGEPIAMIREGEPGGENTKEAWVYRVYSQDATGLYIFFEGDRSVDFTLDTFSGVSGSRLERWFRPQ